VLLAALAQGTEVRARPYAIAHSPSPIERMAPLLLRPSGASTGVSRLFDH